MSRGTTARNVRIDDPLWKAAQFVARHQGTDASELIRQLLGDKIASAAANDDAIAGAPAVRRYLAAGRAPRQRAAVDEDDPGHTLALVLAELHPPAPRRVA